MSIRPGKGRGRLRPDSPDSTVPAASPELDVPDPHPPETKPVSVTQRQEDTRAWLTIMAAGIFVGTLIIAFFFARTSYWPNAKDLLQMVLPIEITLLGAAGGFYFAAKK